MPGLISRGATELKWVVAEGKNEKEMEVKALKRELKLVKGDPDQTQKKLAEARPKVA